MSIVSDIAFIALMVVCNSFMSPEQAFIPFENSDYFQPSFDTGCSKGVLSSYSKVLLSETVDGDDAGYAQCEKRCRRQWGKLLLIVG